MGTRIITDEQTGVQYLFAYDGYAGGLTVLVDKDGKPMTREEGTSQENR
jgi:predicted choloylglycine hydrolase